MPLANFAVYSFDNLPKARGSDSGVWFIQYAHADESNARARAVKMSYEHVGVLFKLVDEHKPFDDSGIGSGALGFWINGHEMTYIEAMEYAGFLRRQYESGELKPFKAEQLTPRDRWVPMDFIIGNKATARFYCCNRHSKNLFRVTPPDGEPYNGEPFYYFGGQAIEADRAEEIMERRAARKQAMMEWVVNPYQPVKPGLRYLERAVKQRGIGGISNALRAIAAEIEAIIRVGNLADDDKIRLVKAVRHLLDASEETKNNV